MRRNRSDFGKWNWRASWEQSSEDFNVADLFGEITDLSDFYQRYGMVRSPQLVYQMGEGEEVNFDTVLTRID